MLSNKKFLKIGSYLGLLSVISSNSVVAIVPIEGRLLVHSRENVEVTRSAPVRPLYKDVDQISYEDFDVTANCPPLMNQFDDWVFGSVRNKIRKFHLDTNIPYIGGINPYVDYASLMSVELYLLTCFNKKLHPCARLNPRDFFEQVIVKNQQGLKSDIKDINEIPDLDCLYYKDVGGHQHLFLRLSSDVLKLGELFNQEISGRAFYAEEGVVNFTSDKDVLFDHANVKGMNVKVHAQNTFLNKASQLVATDTLHLKAKHQKHDTVINKRISEFRTSDSFTHIEEIESIDLAILSGKKVIQEGETADNTGILVVAKDFEDRVDYTTNMPAKVTLHNYAWAEEDDMFSHAEAWVDRLDDYLQPTRYLVESFLSASDKEDGSIKFGYTEISSDAKIICTKNIKEDVVVEERHEERSHQEKSGISFFGGVDMPDPTANMRRLANSVNSGNTMSLTASLANVRSDLSKMRNDYNEFQRIMSSPGKMNGTQIIDSLRLLSHYVNGPSVYIGSWSMDTEQKQTISRGNKFLSPKMVFDNETRSTYAGVYEGDDIKIKTKTFVTFNLPQTFHSKVSVHQTGVRVDLMTLALACCGGAGLMAAALSSTNVNISSQSGEQHMEINEPTVIHARNKLDIEAETGELTQAQIKAGIVHAIFSKDCSLKSLSNLKWSKSEGNGVGFNLGGVASFQSLGNALVNTIASGNISHKDSGKFEKIIDDFAYMVGEKEFYLKVGNVLKTESAFVGHKTHDSAHEHIEAKKRVDTEVKQENYSWNNEWQMSFAGINSLINSIGNTGSDGFGLEGEEIDSDCCSEAEYSPEKATEKSQDKKGKKTETKGSSSASNKKTKAKRDSEAKNTSENTSDSNGDMESWWNECFGGSKDKAKAKSNGATERNSTESWFNDYFKGSKDKEGIWELSTEEKLARVDMMEQQRLAERNKQEAREKISRGNKAVNDLRDLKEYYEKNPRHLVLVNDEWQGALKPFPSFKEENIKKGKEAEVAREFKYIKDLDKAWFNTERQYIKGEGLATKPKYEPLYETASGDDVGILWSAEDQNKPSMHWNRLHQEELGKIGESDDQKRIKELPILGIVAKPYMDYKYGRVDEIGAVSDFLVNASVETASYFATGFALEGVAKAGAVLKNATKAYKAGKTGVSSIAGVGSVSSIKKSVGLTPNTLSKTLKGKEVMDHNLTPVKDKLLSSYVFEGKNVIELGSKNILKTEAISSVAKPLVSNTEGAKLFNFTEYSKASTSTAGQQLNSATNLASKVEIKGQFAPQRISEFKGINDNFWHLNENKAFYSSGKVVGGETSNVASYLGKASATATIREGSSSKASKAMGEVFQSKGKAPINGTNSVISDMKVGGQGKLNIGERPKVGTAIRVSEEKTLEECNIIELSIKIAENKFKRHSEFGKEAGKKLHKMSEDVLDRLLNRYGAEKGYQVGDVWLEKRFFKGSTDSIPLSGYSRYDVISVKDRLILDYKFFKYDRNAGVIFEKKNLQKMIQNAESSINEIYAIKPIFKEGVHTGKFEAIKVWDKDPIYGSLQNVVLK